MTPRYKRGLTSEPSFMCLPQEIQPGQVPGMKDSLLGADREWEQSMSSEVLAYTDEGLSLKPPSWRSLVGIQFLSLIYGIAQLPYRMQASARQNALSFRFTHGKSPSSLPASGSGKPYRAVHR